MVVTAARVGEALVEQGVDGGCQVGGDGGIGLPGSVLLRWRGEVESGTAGRRDDERKKQAEERGSHGGEW